MWLFKRISVCIYTYVYVIKTSYNIYIYIRIYISHVYIYMYIHIILIDIHYRFISVCGGFLKWWYSKIGYFKTGNTHQTGWFGATPIRNQPIARPPPMTAREPMIIRIKRSNTAAHAMALAAERKPYNLSRTSTFNLDQACK